MKDNVTRVLGNLQTAFKQFTTGQKVVAIIGSGALLLAGFMVFKWAAAPSYAPLFSDLAPADASAIAVIAFWPAVKPASVVRSEAAARDRAVGIRPASA